MCDCISDQVSSAADSSEGSGSSPIFIVLASLSKNKAAWKCGLLLSLRKVVVMTSARVFLCATVPRCRAWNAPQFTACSKSLWSSPGNFTCLLAFSAFAVYLYAPSRNVLPTKSTCGNLQGPRASNARFALKIRVFGRFVGPV